MTTSLEKTISSSDPSRQLDATERDRLNELEPLIERGMTSFVEVGTALLEISDRRLYRETHATFAEYCETKWRMTARHAYRLCESAEIVNALPKSCDQLVTSESQARELARVEPERRTAVLEMAASTGTLTAASIRLVADQHVILNAARAINQEDRQARREARLAEVQVAAKLPDAKFRVIYADPPWKYGDQLTEDYGAADHHYALMDLSAICGMAVPAMCEPDAVLFLWVTAPLLPDGLVVMSAWGFTYKTHFVWDKVKHNFGHYSSVRHELLLVGTRGSCVPDTSKLLDSVQSIERTKHSAKPEQFRSAIDALYPYGKRVELFCRGTPGPNWQAWGQEVAP